MGNNTSSDQHLRKKTTTTGNPPTMSGHIGHASSVKVQATPHYSKRVLNVQTKAESPTTRTVDNSSGAEDGDEDEDDEHPDKDEDENDKSNNEDEGNDEDEDNMGEDEDEDFEGECDDENKGVGVEGDNQGSNDNHEAEASLHGSSGNVSNIEAANANSARPLPVSSDHSNSHGAKSKGTSPSSSTRGTPSPSPPPCAPSQSQPFPLPSYDPIPPLDPSIDLSLKGDLPLKEELESSPEPDLPSVSEMLAKTRPPASQPAKSTFQKGRAQGSAHVPVSRSQGDIAANLSRSPMAINDPLSSPTLPIPQPKRPRPVARKVKPRAPVEPSSSSTLSLPATPGDKDGERNRNKGKGKRRASIESVRSYKEDISTESLRPTKRSRLERAAHVAHKHEQFWILDGNTVLEVGGVLFKLHRSRLVDQSSFFAGLLDDQDVHMDDSVVVESDEHGMVYHLSNTTPKDLEALLQLDKNPMAYYFTPPPFPVLAAILRAATALGFDTYRAFAVKVLENAWSSSLADLTTERKPNAVEVVTLARTCGIESVLKRAFYEMVRIAGYGLGDGELDGVDGEGFQEISRADERRLERMREHLISAWSQDAVRVDRSFVCPNQPKETIGNVPMDPTAGTGQSSSTSPTHLPKCPSLSSKRDAWERRVHDSGLYDEYQFDPLCGLQALIDIKWDEDEGWCSCCVRARRDVWTKRRQRTWERIGVWMGLDN